MGDLWGCVGDARGADTVTLSDSGESLDVTPEDPSDDFGLCLAQLRELSSDMGDRAVLLAQLLGHGQGANRCGVAAPIQDLGHCLHWL